MDIKGKSIVITGAASGIGRAMARRFRSEGAGKLVIADLNAEGLQAVADEVDAVAVPTNVAVEGEVVRLIETAEAACDGIDLLCNNAGIGVGGGP